MTALLEFLRRQGAGLWPLALLSALALPVIVHCAALHRMHWTPGPAAEFWRSLGPTLCAVWTALGTLALAGWAAGTQAGSHGLSSTRRALAGAQVGVLGWAVWCLAAVPGLVWVSRLGVPDLAGAAALSVGVLGVVALLAGVVGRVQPFGGAIAGLLGGSALLWATA